MQLRVPGGVHLERASCKEPSLNFDATSDVRVARRGRLRRLLGYWPPLCWVSPVLAGPGGLAATACFAGALMVTLSCGIAEAFVAGLLSAGVALVTG